MDHRKIVILDFCNMKIFETLLQNMTLVICFCHFHSNTKKYTDSIIHSLKGTIETHLMDVHHVLRIAVLLLEILVTNLALKSRILDAGVSGIMFFKCAGITKEFPT